MPGEQWIRPRASAAVASFGRRLAAFILDVTPITAAVFLVAYQIPEFREAFDNYRYTSPDPEEKREFLRRRNTVRGIAGLVYMTYAIVCNVSPRRLPKHV